MNLLSFTCPRSRIKGLLTIPLLSVLVFMVVQTDLYGQRRRVQNLPKYDKQRLHFGFLLGVNVTDFKIKRKESFNLIDSLYVVESDKQTGFNIGIVANLRIGSNFDLRFVPDLAFAQRNLEYSFMEGGKEVVVIKEIESTFLEFPLEIKFKSNRVNNYRAYVIGGIKYTLDMVSQAKVQNKDKDFVKLLRNDFGYQYGVGFDIYMERFKLSPEIKMYHGVRNLLVDDPKVFSSSLDALRSRVFLISFTFE